MEASTQIYGLELVGIEAWEVFTKEGRFAGLAVTKPDGTLRHRYNCTGSKGSTRRFSSICEVLENVDRRLARIKKGRSGKGT